MQSIIIIITPCLETDALVQTKSLFLGKYKQNNNSAAGNFKAFNGIKVIIIKSLIRIMRRPTQ